MKLPRLFLVLLLGSFLAACSASSSVLSTVSPATPLPTATSTDLPETPTPSSGPEEPPAAFPTDVTKSDSQGAVEVMVTPLNLDQPGESLDFEVVMNTHSVDLSMDLSTLATLTTDSGGNVQATLWKAPGGGHHVSGKLSFPVSLDGKSVLDGASQITLTIREVDVPERVFVWELDN